MARDLANVSLEDKYTQNSGSVLISGVQALLRLPLMQKQLDRKAGLNTAGFISGYRGSPLGVFDSALFRESKRLAASDIRFVPGVNEDLAATSVWGTQQLGALPDPLFDGVFSIWYGKGPGVERSADAIRHGNSAGSHRNGGVLLVYGDDHPGKSSTVAHQSEQTLAALSVPSLYPANVHEFLRFGLLGWAMSRYTGLWTGFKCVNETVEQTSTVRLDDATAPILLPALPPELPAGGININPRHFAPAEAEQVVQRHRLPLVHAFVRANRIDYAALGAAQPRFGIVTAGKSYEDTKRALTLLGLDDARLQALGVGVWKVGCIWPLEPGGLMDFASQARSLLFIEEKKTFLEDQARAALYHAPDRPQIWGKASPEGSAILPSDVQFDPVQAARALYRMLRQAEATDAALDAAFQALGDVPALPRPERRADTRMPYFCSGCPHNTSTRLPEGSLAMSGIGCHTMVVYNGQDTTLPPTQMGGEGTNWIGMAPFTKTRHLFQNLGDGTYYHSGLLAIRAAVAAGVNVTYKILYNDAVAMTGGQPVDGPISVADMAAQVLAEGIESCAVVSEDPAGLGRLPAAVTLYHRDDLNTVQERLREVKGVTVIIYQQTCAAEKRRRRKRGLMETPRNRMFINPAVCEGCGDCSAQSGCVSILPKQTPMGIKRQIDQSSCNLDFSCVKGFCPSFVTVRGGKLRKRKAAELDPAIFQGLPQPETQVSGAQSVMVSGIGGTGVVTVGAILVMAAHLQGQAASAYDMTGLAQKNGAVFSHLRFAPSVDQLGPQKLGTAEADLVMAFDAMAATDPDVMKTLRHGHSRVVVNSSVAPSAFFQMAASETALPDVGGILHRLEQAAGPQQLSLLDAGRLALNLSGDSIAVNMMMVGFAYQSGLLPLSAEAIEQAITLNGVAIDFNLRAFRTGRCLVVRPQALGIDPETGPGAVAAETTARMIERHTGYLRSYQNQAWADRFLQQIAALREAETRSGLCGLVAAAAPVLSRLMRYKDEYEVARLYASPEFKQGLAQVFEDGARLEFNFAPPILARKDARTGRPAKRRFGPWILPVLRVMAGGKGLRGTAFDPFGYAPERREERKLIRWYEDLCASCAQSVTPETAQDWIALLALPDGIRGFGPVKEANIARIRQEVALALKSLNGKAGQTRP